MSESLMLACPLRPQQSAALRPEALITAAMAGDDSTHIRQVLTYVIPTATIIDFYTVKATPPPSTLSGNSVLRRGHRCGSL